MEACSAASCGPMHMHPNFAFLMMAGLIVVFVLIPIRIVQIVAWWKICTKAGLNGWLALIMLIPGANIFLPLVVAFMDWPALRELKAVTQAPTSPPQA